MLGSICQDGPDRTDIESVKGWQSHASSRWFHQVAHLLSSRCYHVVDMGGGKRDML